LTGRTLSFLNSGVMPGVSGEISIGERNPAKGCAAQDFTLCWLSILAKEKSAGNTWTAGGSKGGVFGGAGVQLHATGEALFTAAVGDDVDATAPVVKTSLYQVRIWSIANNQHPKRDLRYVLTQPATVLAAAPASAHGTNPSFIDCLR
jgi:hypothetical protein